MAPQDQYQDRLKTKKIVYNGHKRLHVLKVQSITLPDRLIAHLFGPVGKSV